MHVPDGFIDVPTSLVAGGIAAAGIAVSLRGARRELDDRTAPLAGLVAAFIFGAQMINFPVAGGTSGHLLGGVLAAVLVGPYTGALCLSVVLLVQGLFFADGGLTALGVNVTDMSIVGVVVGYLILTLGYALQTGGVDAFIDDLYIVPQARSAKREPQPSGNHAWTSTTGADCALNKPLRRVRSSTVPTS